MDNETLKLILALGFVLLAVMNGATLALLASALGKRAKS
jgi:hypothetical protein